jgi:MFS family permease
MSENEASPETPPDTPEEVYDRFVWDNLRRNYTANYVHGMLGMTGFRLVNAPTIVPAYLHMLSGSNFVVGLGMALQQLGGVVSPLVGAAHVEHRPKLMPVAVLLGTLMRLPLLAMAITGWMMRGQPLLITLIVMLFLMGLFSGSQRVVFQLLMAKVIPISRRGRLQAWRNLTGGAIAAILAYLAGRYLIEDNVFGNGYATTFMIAFLLTTAGLTVLQVLIREPVSPHLPLQTRFRDRMKDFPALVAGDRDYRNFLIAQLFAMAARVAAPFYVLHAGKVAALTGAQIGLLSLAYLGADTFSNLVWGYLGDRGGFRSSFVASLVLFILSTVLLMVAHNNLVLIVAFFGLGAAQSGYSMSSSTMVLEFGARQDVAMRLGISSTVEGLMSFLGPLAGGIIASFAGYGPVFGLSIALQAIALVVLVVAVKEPRLRQVG